MWRGGFGFNSPHVPAGGGRQLCCWRGPGGGEGGVSVTGVTRSPAAGGGRTGRLRSGGQGLPPRWLSCRRAVPASRAELRAPVRPPPSSRCRPQRGGCVGWVLWCGGRLSAEGSVCPWPGSVPPFEARRDWQSRPGVRGLRTERYREYVSSGVFYKWRWAVRVGWLAGAFKPKGLCSSASF